MEILQKIEGTQLNIEMKGRFTFSDRELINNIITSIRENSITRVSIDMNSLEYMDSSSIGMLLILNDKAATLGSSIQIENAEGCVKALFDYSKLNEIFKITTQ